MDNSRLIALRNILKISQGKFAKTLNISTTYFAEIEKSAKELTDIMISKIVITYGVREKWLRKGVLPIFNNEAENQRIANTVDLAVNIKNQLGNMTLQELAKQMEISYPTMRGIITSGKCSKERINKMSEILQVPTEDFYRTLDNQLINKGKMTNKQSIKIGNNSQFTNNNVFGDLKAKDVHQKTAQSEPNNNIAIYKDIVTMLKEQLAASEDRNIKQELLINKQQKQIVELNKKVSELYEKLLNQS